ncbi:DUF4038 domain-containing protein [Paludisphaera sp.]|uniref:apiosidase-like domain-containing protein n=1 Tax=Paludisphaera sp. TaxID=2017432 RepID=UPI00301D6EDE
MATRIIGGRIAPVLFLGTIVALAGLARAAAPVEAGKVAEISFESRKARPDPFHDVALDVVFTAPDGATFRVPAFWAGGSTWKVRYSGRTPGVHRYRTECADVDDAALHGVEGAVEVVPYAGDNPLLRHGPVRAADDRRHFAHADGTPFFWLGDTWWMGLSERLAFPDDFRRLVDDRVAKGFNVVQIVAGLYPDMPAFDPRGRNEAGFPWEPDYARINPAYFDAADRRIAELAERGLTPCVVGAWGYHLPWLGEARMKQHWRYLVARWGAYPVVWCVAGETTMPFYLSNTKAEDSERQKRGWTEVAAYLREIDPFHRLVTTHPSRTARESVTDPAVLDFDMQQTGHGTPPEGHAALASQGWDAMPTMPVISGEARYEALEINPTLTDADARKAFWSHVVASGCAGHTYGVNGVWQVNRKDHPYGNSPAGNNWGTTPWDVAMSLPGSSQLAAAARLITSIPGWDRFEPRPDLVAWADPAEKAPAPLCVATPDGSRLIYILKPGAARLTGLPAEKAFELRWFDPVSGTTADPVPLPATPDGAATISPPDGDHDWAVVVTPKG